MHRPMLSLASLLVVGCSGASLNPHGSTSAPSSYPRGTSSPLDPKLTPQPGDVPSTIPRTATSAESRRVCRSNGVPRGWVAVSYEAGTSECPAKPGRDEHTVAVIVSLKSQPVQSTIDVCGDQHVPIDWTEERDASVDNGACPGATSDGRSMTKRIRRVR